MALQSDAPERSWNKVTPAVLGAPTRENAMIAALATVLFLATLWLIAMLALTAGEQCGAKILAAVRGQSPLATAPVAQPISWKVSPRARSARSLRARPMLRAAA